jgi:hypothetical protein
MEKNQIAATSPILITWLAKRPQSHVIEGAEPCQSGSPILHFLLIFRNSSVVFPI